MNTPGRTYLEGLHNNIEIVSEKLAYWADCEARAEADGDVDALNYATAKWESTHKTWHMLQQKLREYHKNDR
jgi:hypothetical protein